ncbi:membrane protein [Congregibacter litoralis]|uniref:O-antigen ligase like membrane protein n=1 Tax=Congregibacter litoralis KT71 TaxID=314285 RepID=A4AB84_9GAMM|nr:membrane protein [Congregibacter litoralis]EAQ96638.1 O-antigen ligase like membrane protein [Congregibacter litoralis KT71]
MQSNTTATSPFQISLNPLIYAAIFMATFAGCQGGRYYLANRLQELGIACALLLFVMGCWQGFFRLSYREWKAWVVSPVLLLGGIIGISSVVFVLNYSGSVLFSAFSAREFLLAFMGPGIYLLVRCGLPLPQVERTIWCALFALMVNYLVFYFTMDLRAAFFSSDHTVSNLVTYDAWRGFRLKPPLFAIMVALLGSLALLFQSRGKAIKTAAIVSVALAAYIWSIVLFRSTLATMILSVLLYPILLSHRTRLKLIVVAAPLAVLAIPVIGAIAAENFMEADGGSIRAKAFLKALEHIALHPILGAGEDSAYGLSYQDIVAKYFFPSDLGLVGVTYKYGIVGVLLYLTMHGKIWLRLWSANMDCRDTDGRINPLLWGMFIFMTAQTFNLALNPGLAYAQGITLGSLALALGSLHRMRCALAPSQNPPILEASETMTSTTTSTITSTMTNADASTVRPQA